MGCGAPRGPASAQVPSTRWLGPPRWPGFPCIGCHQQALLPAGPSRRLGGCLGARGGLRWALELGSRHRSAHALGCHCRAEVHPQLQVSAPCLCRTVHADGLQSGPTSSHSEHHPVPSAADAHAPALPDPTHVMAPSPVCPLRVNLSLALPATRKAGPSGCPARSARPHRPSSQPSLLSARNLLSLPGGSALGPRCLGGDQPLPPGADLPATPLTNTTNSSLARCAPPRAALGTRRSSTSCRRKPEPREVRNARRVTQPGRRRRLSDCRAMCPHCPPLCQGHISQVPAASHCPPAHTFPRSPSGRNLTAVPKPP